VTILVWILIGALVGGAAILVQGVQGAYHRLLNLIAGVAGAIGGGLAAGKGSVLDDPLRMKAMVVAAAGAIILVGIVNLFRRRPAG
jgi:uncharacterized membrane protein YeaQ/YmgE (transglycosylase-associated protein family)